MDCSRGAIMLMPTLLNSSFKAFGTSCTFGHLNLLFLWFTPWYKSGWILVPLPAKICLKYVSIHANRFALKKRGLSAFRLIGLSFVVVSRHLTLIMASTGCRVWGSSPVVVLINCF